MKEICATGPRHGSVTSKKFKKFFYIRSEGEREKERESYGRIREAECLSHNDDLNNISHGITYTDGDDCN